MDRPTVQAYEERGGTWAANRRPVRRASALAFGRRVRPGGLRLDLGAGAGRYTGHLGRPTLALDAAASMLDLLGRSCPEAWRVRADLEALPLRPGAGAGAWANMSYQHLPRSRLPLALADLHRSLEPGSPLDLQVLRGDYEGDALPDDDVGGRFFAGWEEEDLVDVVTGAGFTVDAVEQAADRRDVIGVRGRRARSLPDLVGPGLRLLVCGLNPSLYAADAGVGFARPGNRFWPAALAAGLVTRDRDPWHALRHHRMGMTDLSKRATVAAAEIAPDEYRRGLARVERLVARTAPAAVVVVGLAGWRAAVERRARPGPVASGLGGRPCYLMPSTSGLNARTPLAELAGHLRAAVALGGTG